MNGRVRAIAGATTIGVVTIALLLFRLDSDERNQIDSESIVMLGDSITAEGQWSELLADEAVVNAGHSGFTTAQLVPIASEVATSRPRLLLVLTGTNDIRDGHPPSWTIGHLEELLDNVASSSPDTAIVLQTVLPREDRVPEVAALNEALTTLAAQRGLQLLDLYADFDDGRGGLRDAETYDGLHLTEAGYARWTKLVRPVIDLAP